MKKATFISTLLLVVFIIALLYTGNEYRVFRAYKSLDLFGEKDRQMTDTATAFQMRGKQPLLSYWDWGIRKYYRYHYKSPSWKEFYNFIEADSAVFEECPNIMPEQIRAKDFVITTDSLDFYYLWLFAGSLPDSSNFLFSDRTNVTDWHNMTFMDFLLRRSILIGTANLDNICGHIGQTQIVYNKRQIQDARLEAGFRAALYRALFRQGYTHNKTETLDVCCLHIYFEDRHIQVEILDDSCVIELTASLCDAMLSEFKTVTPDYHKYEFYFNDVR